MPGSPLVSVLLPCRDAEATLDAAMESLVTQTFGQFEILAVDDGSTDQTAALLANWANRDQRIQVLSTEPSGIIEALNSAASEASAVLLARMDADDIAHPTRLERQVQFLNDRPELSGCGTGIRYFPRHAVRDGARRYELWINALVHPEDIERDLFIECPIPHPTLMLKRDVFRRVGGYRDSGWPEDYDLVLRLSTAGYRLGKVPEVLLKWRDSPTRLSRTHSRYSADAFRKCKIRHLRPRIGGRAVVICGAGPLGKSFALDLQSAGHQLAAFVDLDPRKIGQSIHGATVAHPTAINDYHGHYFLAAVGAEKARWEIREYLSDAGLTEIVDFCAVA